MPYRKSPSELTGNELDAMFAVLRDDIGGLYWIPEGDRFVISSGQVTRAGRALRAAGFIRTRTGQVVWLPGIPGAGRRDTDQPARVMEITPLGRDALRRRMGPAAFDRLVNEIGEQRRRQWDEQNRLRTSAGLAPLPPLAEEARR